MKKFTPDYEASDVLLDFIDQVNQDPKIVSLIKQLRKRYHELEKGTGFNAVMKDDEAFETMSDMMDQHTRNIDPQDTDIFTYLWYNA